MENYEPLSESESKIFNIKEIHTGRTHQNAFASKSFDR